VYVDAVVLPSGKSMFDVVPTGEYIHHLRTLPGLKKYIIVKTLPALGATTDFAHMAVLYSHCVADGCHYTPP
jgi:hypothetical protein